MVPPDKGVGDDAASRWLAFGPFVFDRTRAVLRRAGETIELPERSSRLLAVLIEAPDEILSKDRLIAAVWRGRFVSDTSLTEAMSRLRQALGTDAREQRYIRTVHGRGYRFVAPVTAVEVGAENERARRARVPAAAASTVWTWHRLPHRLPVAASLAALGLLGLLMILGLVGGNVERSSGPASEAARAEPRYRLAEVSLDGARVLEYGVPALPLKGFSVERSGGRVAFAMASGEGSDAWVFEPALGELRRVATGGRFLDPVWRPDGRAVALAEQRGADFDLVVKVIDDDGPVEVLLEAPFDQFPESWSHDGGELVFSQRHPESGYDLWLLRRGADGDWRPLPLVATAANEAFGAISPSGLLVAYTSMANGRSEVYVISLAPGARTPPIAAGTGSYPFWSRDGDLLHYVEGDTLLTVAAADLTGGGARRSRRSAPLSGLYLAASTDTSDRVVVAVRDQPALRLRR